MFTLADKGLLDRAARQLLEEAAAIENLYGKPAWVGEEARKEKLVFDRLQRDARDLRSLAKRLANHFQRGRAMFTLADKGLLDRAARQLLEEAAAIENLYGKPAWVGEEARKEKLVFDRLQRDARDLRSLAKRLANHFQVAPAPRQPKAVFPPPDSEAKVVGGVLDAEMKVFPQETAAAEPSIEEQRALGVLGGHGADLQGLGIGHG